MVTRDKDSHHIIKGSIHQDDKTIINILAPHNGAHKYIKQIQRDVKGEMNNTITVADFNTIFSKT